MWPFKRPVPLSTALAVAFAVLTIPALVAILVVSYWRNSVSINRILDNAMTQEKRDTERLVDDLVRPVATTLALLAEYAESNTSFLFEEVGASALYRALENLPQANTLQVAYEDGRYRSLSRIGKVVLQKGTELPSEARYTLTSRVHASAERETPRIARQFISTWPSVLRTDSVALTRNPQERPVYLDAKKNDRMSFAPPWLNPDTGEVVVSIGYPIRHGGIFKGIIGANITFAELSHFLYENRVSEHSSTTIVGADGSVVARSDDGRSPDSTAVSRKLQSLDDLTSPEIEKALASTGESSRYILTRTEEGEKGEVSVLSFDMQGRYDLGLRALIVTPVDDFVGPLKQTNHTILLFICALIVLDWVLLRRLSQFLSRGIENLSNDFVSLQSLKFTEDYAAPSPITEVAEVQRGVALLRNALGSFSLFVPMGVVRQLVESGRPLALGVETKQLTILFCDLENFTAHAERLAPDQLLNQISAYFSMVTEAVAAEQGTVDKFIGDAVMAFWGAPVELENHALSACRSAMRIVRGMARLNESWVEQGKPTMRMRIGINTAEVLVGNIGSNERLNYTAIGDGVNVASRLQSINKQFGSCVCISDSVYAAVSEHVVVRPLGCVTVKGRSSEFPAYELLGIRGEGDPNLATLEPKQEVRETVPEHT